MRSRTLRRGLPTGLLLILLPGLLAGCATLQEGGWTDVLGGQAGPLDEGTVAAGLREALRVGTERAVDTTSRVDGFLADELIRIALPSELEPAADVLRGIGLGGEVDRLELTMNRAAERASGEAVDLFWEAIRGMTLADAFAILEGPDDAATSYFRERTEGALRARFQPLVQGKMEELGLYGTYEGLLARYQALPLAEKPDLDLTSYVTEHALAGLFTVLAREEGRIREDPLARTTALLQRVFGNRDAG